MTNSLEMEPSSGEKKSDVHLASLHEAFLNAVYEQSVQQYETDPEFRASVDRGVAVIIERHKNETERGGSL